MGWTFNSGSLALRRIHAGWVRIPTVDEGTADNVLNAISVHTPQDIWAVGHAQQKSLTVHYDGAGWTVVPSPNREYGIRLEDVVAIAEDDVWAVGWTGSNNFDDENIAMHTWRRHSTSWTIVPTPQPGDGIDRLFAIDAAGPNDVWATGTYGDFQGSYLSSIFHWDGTSWSIVAHPCHTYGGLTGITVLSPTDVWAVGNATTCHYDGTTWRVVPSPQPRIEFDEIAYPLEDVSGAGPKDVWAVGARVIDLPKRIEYQAIAEHWDGSAWTLATFIPGTQMLGVEAVAANDVWAVGTNAFGPLIAHWDGSEWSTVPTPEWGRGGRLSGIEMARNEKSTSPGMRTGPLWAAGHYLPGNVGRGR